MCKLIAVTDRRLCKGDFTKRITAVSECGVDVILRAKELTENEYEKLLRSVLGERIIPHGFIGAARRAGCKRLHLPLSVLESNPSAAAEFQVSVSIHSLEQLKRAMELGAAAVTAGHVFETRCKEGLAGRGTGFIKEIKAASDIPVYAIGGISPQNAAEVIRAGVDGVCVMSGFMQCEDVGEYIKRFLREMAD